MWRRSRSIKPSGRITMLHRSSTRAFAMVAGLVVTVGGAQAADDAKYPDWKGQWYRFVVPGVKGQPSFDQTKSWGPGQQAPLTREYQKVLEDSMADQAKGGLGNYFQARCLGAGMPHMMIGFSSAPLEFIITPETTYILIGFVDHFRRIFTYGRASPHAPHPPFPRYSTATWSY